MNDNFGSYETNIEINESDSLELVIDVRLKANQSKLKFFLLLVSPLFLLSLVWTVLSVLQLLVFIVGVSLLFLGGYLENKRNHWSLVVGGNRITGEHRDLINIVFFEVEKEDIDLIQLHPDPYGPIVFLGRDSVAIFPRLSRNDRIVIAEAISLFWNIPFQRTKVSKKTRKIWPT